MTMCKLVLVLTGALMGGQEPEAVCWWQYLGTAESPDGDSED